MSLWGRCGGVGKLLGLLNHQGLNHQMVAGGSVALGKSIDERRSSKGARHWQWQCIIGHILNTV